MGSDQKRRGRPVELSNDDLEYVFEVAPAIKCRMLYELNKHDYRVRCYSGMSMRQILEKKRSYSWDGEVCMYTASDFRYDRDAGRLVNVPSQRQVNNSCMIGLEVGKHNARVGISFGLSSDNQEGSKRRGFQLRDLTNSAHNEILASRAPCRPPDPGSDCQAECESRYGGGICLVRRGDDNQEGPRRWGFQPKGLPSRARNELSNHASQVPCRQTCPHTDPGDDCQAECESRYGGWICLVRRDQQ